MADLQIPIAYIKQVSDESVVSLSVFQLPQNNGVAGAKLGIEDSNTTGRFLKHHFDLTVIEHAQPADLVAATLSWLKGNQGVLVLDVSDDVLQLLLSSPETSSMLMINATNQSDKWRQTQCRARLLHTAPSYAMLGDALGQFLLAKRWRKWFLVLGQSASDKAMAAAFERASKRFGTKIVERKTWTFDTDLRRSAQQEVPGFTQGDDYDVVLVADTDNQFGFYLPYNTWLPRPVVGTQGLTAVAWHPAIEQWGAVQLQNRFYDAYGRAMTADDYNGWLAVRAIAEGVTRTGESDPNRVYDYLTGDKFELAAFKGRKLTFRKWNGQLRQPIPLAHAHGLVSQSPQQGFLHPVTDLDTLGYDKPEVTCRMVKE
ncbi:ABC transporter substrate-binding protein [Alteromonas sp. C1M14]|uniref:ABC transporter substrate-binding protein n=1 Tax=Alteromonas sp. C1M14 TaxID=2841567 RepID=UPI001C083087|nr:ABC transporter substrate-binding protein [Alteromonas sp. C1M14]MBU2978159.1 ABC transporter substrate-binding protein [Alteromonas sp. C1M14]